MSWSKEFRLNCRQVALSIPTLPLQVAWEGRKFTPTPNTDFWRETIIYLDSNTATLGRTGFVQEDLIYQITLEVSLDTPITDIDDMWADIEQYFWPARQVGGVTNHGEVVRTTKTVVNTNEDWRNIVISVYCFVRRKSYPFG